jgi:hypothetical protein
VSGGEGRERFGGYFARFGHAWLGSPLPLSFFEIFEQVWAGVMLSVVMVILLVIAARF